MFFISNSCNNCETSFVSKTAPDNSKRGIVSRLSGATFVFEAKSKAVTSPLLLVVRKYTTTAIACWEASQNPCISITQSD